MKHILKFLSFSLFLAGLCADGLLAAPIISNATFSQRAPASKLVDVTVVSVDGVDRLVGGRRLGEWTNGGDLESWAGSNTSGLGVAGGLLVGDDSSNSVDASISLTLPTGGPDLDLGFNDYLQIRVKLPEGYPGGVKFEFGTSTNTGFSTKRQFAIPSAQIPKDGAFHTYRLDLGLEVFWRDELRDLRVTPIVAGTGHFEIDYVEVGDVDGTAPLIDLDAFFSETMSAATASRMESKHACVWWDPADTTFTTAHARRALRMCEESYQVFCKKLDYSEPFVELNSPNSPRYKINMTTWFDGYWMSYIKRGCLNVGAGGLADEGWGNPVPHEFGHVLQSAQPGFLTGGHWESHADYLRAARNLHFYDVFSSPYSAIENLTGSSNYRPDHPRNIYADHRYYLALDDYGTQFGLPQNYTAHAWRDGVRGLTLIEKLASQLPSGISVKDVALECLKRWPMLDFVEKGRLRAEQWGTESARAVHFWKQGAQLIPQQDKPGWWRVPLERAPDGWAYQMHDLSASPGATVTAELRGLDMAGAGEDWRWCFAAISEGDTVRYSPVWAPGTQSFTLNANESQVFLVVTATPAVTALDLSSYSNTKPVDKHPDRLRYAYEVRLANASPAPHPYNALNPAGYRRHGNGGGIVGPLATVASSAYVGPNAKVLGSARVLGAARVEDYAVVQGSATLQGSAIVSGSALVEGDARVEGNARIRDRAHLAWGAIARGRALVAGYTIVQGTTIQDDAIVRGCAQLWPVDKTLGGTAIFDHDGSMGESFSDGVHFSHVPWGGWFESFYRQTLRKPRGLISSYRTEEPDGEMWWDEFGALHAVMRGAPVRGFDAAFNSTVMTFDGVDDYAAFDRSLADTPALSFSGWVKPTNAVGVAEPILFMGKSAAAAIALTRNAAGKAVLSVSDGASTATLTSDSRLDSGAWQHVAFSLDGATAKLYINGALEFSAATRLTPLNVLAANSPSDAQANYLGRGWSGGGVFKGSFEDVRFYNVAFTAAEVRQELSRRGDLLAAFSPITPTAFNGTSTIGESGARNGRVRTLSAWVKPRGSKSVSNYEAVLDSGSEYESGNGSGFGLNAGKWVARIDGLGRWNTDVSAVLSRWQHVALAFNGSTANFFINGVRVATRSYTGPASDSDAVGKCFRVGYSQATEDTASREFFDGLILNARVHESFLDSSQLVLDSDGDGFNDSVEADFASSPLDPASTPPNSAVAGSVVNSTGEAVAGATITISDTPGGTGITVVADAAGGFSRKLPPGTWYLRASGAGYNLAERTVVVGAASISGIDFTLVPAVRISGRVTERRGGAPVAGATVWFSRTAGAAGIPDFTATTDANGSFTQAVQDGMWYVAAGGTAFLTSFDKAVTVAAPAAPAAIHFELFNTLDAPRADALLFSVLTSSLPGSGNAGDWPTHRPSGQALTPMGSPTVQTLNGVRWVDNLYLDGDGFLQGVYNEPVKIDGATIVVAVRPKRNAIGTDWTSIVDLFFSRLTLGIRNSTGEVDVWRNGELFTSGSDVAIPDGQATVLSLVARPNGQFKVFANGVAIMEVTSTSDMTSLVPNVAGGFANAFNVGRNNPDGWSVFNGKIGDVFVYGVELSAAERQQIESDLTARFLHPGYSTAFLANLSPSAGLLSPAFASGVTDYTVMVPNATSALSLVPVAFEPTANVRINGSPVTSGVASAPVALAVGANTISTVVTAQDGVTERVYTVRVVRAPSSNADLAGLALSSGVLSPVFSNGVTQYTATVTNAAASVTVTPATTDATASVRVNGEPLSSGAASSPIALAVGVNQIRVVVTAQDQTTVAAYTVSVSRAPSSTADLLGLTLSSGTLSPAFSSEVTDYTVMFPNATSVLSLVPVTLDPTANLRINGSPAASGVASAPVALSVGANTITTVVTAQDGVTQRMYSVRVVRAPSANADLAGLALSSGALSPAFSGGVTQYTASVPHAAASVTVTPATADATASVRVNGDPVSSGSASGPIALAVGTNPIRVVVTAQNQTTVVEYTVNVTRAPSANADLAGLALSSGALSPAFSSGVTQYTANVPHAAASVTVTPATADATASVRVNGDPVASGSASGPIALAVGVNAIRVVVTAQNQTTVVEYTVNVTRVPSANADLAGLALSSGALSPAFSSGVTQYTVNVPNGTAAFALSPVAADSNATMRVNGYPVVSGVASAPLALAVGPTTLTTVVTAQDGVTERVYSVNVIRAPSAHADLAGLALSSGTLSPAFSGGVTQYTANVPHAADSMTVIPATADATATVRVNGEPVSSGTASGPIALAVGANPIRVVVTAQDQTTVADYTINVTRDPSSNADLAGLALSSGALSPAFSSGVTQYTASVPHAAASVTVTPATADATASVRVNGEPVASGSASGPIALAVGTNPIRVVVTAQNQTTVVEYTVHVIRAPSANADLAGLTANAEGLSPAFSSAVTSYTLTVPYNTTLLTLTPVTADATASLNVNGTPVASGTSTAPIPLQVGVNTVQAVVTAQDGATALVYTVSVTRTAPSVNADLSALVPSAGTLSPALNPSQTSYTLAVPHSVESLRLAPGTVHPAATVKINGAPVASGTASAPVALAVGTNTLSVLVTAEDASTTKTYALTVTRAAAVKDAGLAGLTPAEGVLSPVFDVNTTSYRLDYATPVLSTRFLPVTRHPNQRITVNGKPVASGKYSADIALPAGESTIQVVVTAPDRVTQRTYTVEVWRPAIAVADLSSLKLSAGSLSPAFSADTTQYSVLVPETVTAVKVTAAAAQPSSVITVDDVTLPSGRASGWYGLAPGENAIAVVVTAEDGVTTKTYTLTITRQPGFAGAYDGVAVPVADTTDPGSAVALAGMTVSRTGAFSGKLLLGGRAAPVSLRGVMDVSGVARFGSRATTDNLQISTPGRPALTLSMRMDVQLPFTHQIVGTLSSNSQRVADFVLNRRLYSAAANPVEPLSKVPEDVLNLATDNGRYTAFFKALSPAEQGLEDSAYPQGDGWAVFTVRSSGAVSMVGELADGQAFTYTNYLSQDRVLPFYVARPGGGGSASGRITFRDVPGQSDADALGLRWFKRANPRDAAYPKGWPGGIRVDFFASKFVPPAVTQKTVVGADPVVAPGVNAVLSLSGGGLSGELANQLAVGLRGLGILGAPAGGAPVPGLRLTLGADGKIAGQFRGTAPVTRIRGAVFQNTQSGAGYFLSAPAPGEPQQSGRVRVVTP